MQERVIKSRENVLATHSITGVENTKRGVEVKPDWLSFTFTGDNSLTVRSACDFLGIPREEWFAPDGGGHGYHNQLIYGNIHIYYGGGEDMGIFISMTGEGCREYEKEINGDWQTFIKEVLIQGGNFTRFDSAIDDFEGALSLNKIKFYAKKKQIVSKFKAWGVNANNNMATGAPLKDEICFGNKAHSLIHLAIYDKALEQGTDGHWIRAELRLKKKRAHRFLEEYVESGNLGLTTSSVLSKYIKFVTPSTDSNRSRWPIAKFWEKFLGETKKIKLTMGEVKESISKKIEWLQKQCATSLALVARYFKGDISFIADLIVLGDRKLKPRHFMMLSERKAVATLHHHSETQEELASFRTIHEDIIVATH